MSKPWQQAVAAKLAIRDALIHNHGCNVSVLPQDIADIADDKELTQHLKSGHFSAENVVHAYIQR
jgi:hypothetical protein